MALENAGGNEEEEGDDGTVASDRASAEVVGLDKEIVAEVVHCNTEVGHTCWAPYLLLAYWYPSNCYKNAYLEE